jgi:hypothetical protein
MKQLHVVASRLVKVYVNPIVIRLPFGHSSLAMKDKDGLEGCAAIRHHVKDNSGLPLVPAIAFRFAGHRVHPFEIIGIAVEKFKRQWCFI